MLSFFFFNDTATTEIYTLSLHDALPIFCRGHCDVRGLVIIVCLLSRQASWTQGFRARLEQSHNTPFPVSPGLRFAAVFWLVNFSDFQTFQQSLSKRSEEHTSELQSRQYLVCRLLLEKKKN